MKVPMKRFVSSLFLSVAAGMAINATAAPLQLADKPLFLGYTVNPNVFFSLDDSGSMDWEITAVPHWDACRYDKAYPAFSSGGCNAGVRDAGEWNAAYFNEKKKATDTVWQSSGGGAYKEFSYVFDNGALNLYGQVCNDSNTMISSCATTSNSDTSERDLTCTGSSCTAPSGGSCSGSGSSKKCYTAYYTVNNRTRLYSLDWRVYSADFNVTYYNPSSTYSPWVRTGMTDASFSAVRANPESTLTGYSTTRNLGATSMNTPFAPGVNGFIYEVWSDSHGYQTTISGASTTVGPDKYDRTTGANGQVDMWDNHSRYVVTGTTMTRYDITYSFDGSNNLVETVSAGVPVTSDAQGRSLAQVQQNIANWYQYSRRRMYVAKGAIALVINQNNKFRFGITAINKTGSTTGNLFVEMPASTVTDYTTHNTNLITKLYQFPQPEMSTPLREGLDNAGRYYSGQALYSSGAGSISSTTRTRPITEACQQNFTVLFTDGYWSTGTVQTAVGDRDGDTRTTLLADVARYYADHDLDTTKSNNVPVGTTGTTTFQHMVTYTAAFGVQGELRDTDDDASHLPDKVVDSATGAITDFTPSYSALWGDGSSTNTGKIDDMWHAAYNSGGDFISAATPQDLVAGLQTALRSIEERTGSSAAVAASSGAYQSSTSLYLAKFNSGDWSGELEAYPLVTTAGVTTISTLPSWKASTRLNTLVAGSGYSADRKVVTYNPKIVNGSIQGKGVPFRMPTTVALADTLGGVGLEQLALLLPFNPSTTTAAEITANLLQGSALVNWLRGDRSLEGTTSNGVSYRQRSAVLGDIVESSPQYVGAPDRLYSDTIQAGNKYSTFRTSNASRTPMLYVGANDGMLHAFRASDGIEQYAFIPSSVTKRLKDLKNPGYAHKYSVNGSVEINDVFVGGSWRTILMGGLSAGGQGIYALDVTSPTAANEAAAASKVLWEFTDKNYVASTTAGAAGSNGDPNLGYTFSRPQMIKMANNKWMAVFGNGYNNTEADGSASTTGYAYLYFVDIATGKLEHRIEVPFGSTTTPNGLSTVTSIDIDGDYKSDYIYGGDLYGNMWRFDVSSSAVSDWKIAYSGKPIFTTQTDQQITVKPSVTRHPTGSGVMVLFGTGKYLEFEDAQIGGQTTQSLYAIWDNIGITSTYPVTRAQLLQQTIQSEVTHATSNAEVRVTSNSYINWSQKRGWYMDLIYGTNNKGELVMADSIVRGDRVIFISVTPATTACEPGGTSWIYELDYVDGSRLPYSPIDVNQDGQVSALDNVTYGGNSVAGGGFKRNSIITSPKILSDTAEREQKVFSSSAGSLMTMAESTSGLQGRRSWRQLR